MGGVMNSDTDFSLADELMPGEYIIWSGKPNLRKIFTKSDLVLIPFSIFWCGFAIFWTFSAYQMGGMFSLFGIPFVIVGLYITFGRFIVRAIRKKSTVYAITNKRVLVVIFNSAGVRKSSLASALQDIHNESLSVRSDKTGSIIFGSLPFYTYNSGFNFSGNNQPGIPAFFDIDDVETVYASYKKAKYDA
jgi:hypothetical protein